MLIRERIGNEELKNSETNCMFARQLLSSIGGRTRTKKLKISLALETRFAICQSSVASIRRTVQQGLNANGVDGGSE